MIRTAILIIAFLIQFTGLGCVASAQPVNYRWLASYDSAQSIANRISPPPQFFRGDVEPGSFGGWLRSFPLKAGSPPVYLYDGQKKVSQEAHFAVLDIDVGGHDLQQCADAVIRLRAEYLFSIKRPDLIHFKFTSGDNASWDSWQKGFRPQISGNRVDWTKTEPIDSSYANFRQYLEKVFEYAGTTSLKGELSRVDDIRNMEIGDVFIIAKVSDKIPGHAVIVVDMATNRDTGEKIFLLAQSYMPAQEIHILKNPRDEPLSPWYRLDFSDTLYTSEWTFLKSDLMRLK